MAFYFVAAQIIIVVASAAYSIQQAKKQKEAARKAAEARRGFEIPIEGQSGALPIVYGRAKIGGFRVYHSTASDFKFTAPNSDKVFGTGLTDGDRP